MLRLLTFLLMLWIINRVFRILLPASKKSSKSPPENKPRQSRRSMDIQDGEFEDVE